MPRVRNTNSGFQQIEVQKLQLKAFAQMTAVAQKQRLVLKLTQIKAIEQKCITANSEVWAGLNLEDQQAVDQAIAKVMANTDLACQQVMDLGKEE